MQSNTNDLLTVYQAADLARCSHQYLYAEIARGHLAIIEIAGKKFISHAELDEFIKRPKLHDQKSKKSA